MKQKELINLVAADSHCHEFYKGRLLVIDYFPKNQDEFKWMITDQGMIIKRYARTKEEVIKKGKKAWDNWLAKEAKNG